MGNFVRSPRTRGGGPAFSRGTRTKPALHRAQRSVKSLCGPECNRAGWLGCSLKNTVETGKMKASGQPPNAGSSPGGRGFPGPSNGQECNPSAETNSLRPGFISYPTTQRLCKPSRNKGPGTGLGRSSRLAARRGLELPLLKSPGVLAGRPLPLQSQSRCWLHGRTKCTVLFKD